MFGRLGTTELILILIIALVIFGPSKLPELGKALGKSLKEFKSHADKITENPEKETIEKSETLDKKEEE
ncbi:twin-arginine translocase TatA/TatE family subunit [Alkaliphilus sp. MSJ-5]|uniref:Sec-independent protein translocase protein TatA n=1 Tax=Alkaliphilus flagellatus TaxID=2841507 RepID=A0ABS6G3X8_9FIRM|nr:twin-arginine translocase TatA/TatE family subunit [Alkaliphilus flagellatus]MBU5677195.1 twin-arginine translocase TatA/TatE family subunit [Alkaliphilus flagellatus]